MITALCILTVGIALGLAYKFNGIQMNHSAEKFSIRLVQVVYGKPAEDLYRSAEAGHVYLAGCDKSVYYPPRVLLINWPSK